jgi:hypothetical protein
MDIIKNAIKNDDSQLLEHLLKNCLCGLKPTIRFSVSNGGMIPTSAVISCKCGVSIAANTNNNLYIDRIRQSDWEYELSNLEKHIEKIIEQWNARNASNNDFELKIAEYEKERNIALDDYFSHRPHLKRTKDEERLFIAGFERAWNLKTNNGIQSFSIDKIKVI